MSNIGKRKLKAIIDGALDHLYKEDAYLISNQPPDWHNFHGDPEGIKDGHVGERAIVFRFGLYLWTQINSSKSNSFKKYNLDCEYNRNGYDKKSFVGFENGAYPDLIIHKRGSNEDNLLVIEFKTWWNTDTTKDIEKIKGLMSSRNCYKYRYGVSIVLTKNRKECIPQWISDSF